MQNGMFESEGITTATLRRLLDSRYPDDPLDGGGGDDGGAPAASSASASAAAAPLAPLRAGLRALLEEVRSRCDAARIRFLSEP